MKTFRAFASMVLALTLLTSCQKEEKSTPLLTCNLMVKVSHKVDLIDLYRDSLLYTTQAGFPYSVSRLEYYLSGFKLSGNSNSGDNSVHYINAFKPTTHFQTLVFTEGTYNQFQFNIGLDATKNLSYSLAPTPDNINMAWPPEIGGGYHFLKLEGRYLDSGSVSTGYVMHVGQTENLITISLPVNLVLKSSNTADTLRLEMNINEWFRNPVTYDFRKHGYYTMAIDSLMNYLKQNGHDVFSIKK